MSAGDSNPYLASAALAPPSPGVAFAPSLASLARGVFLAWEKLRLAYLAALTVVTALLVAASGELTSRALLNILEGAVAANLLYFAGPLLEAYIRWLGYHSPWPRWLMFLGGTLLSVLLAIGVLGGSLIPNQP